MRQLCMVGMFPPPLMGMAAINLAMLEHFSRDGRQPLVINLSTGSLSQAWHVRVRRIINLPLQLLRFVLLLLRNRGRISVYMGVSAGYGQLFEIPFVLLSRALGARLFIHHHSVLYINWPRWLNRAYFRAAGSRATHVALCKCMAARLRSSFPVVCRVHVISNSAILPQLGPFREARKEINTIGFLSNIEPDKGIMEFLNIAERLEEAGAPFRIFLAGPFREAGIEETVTQRISTLKCVRYVGPKYGEEKSEFFSQLDVLIYPTKNDAEPLIVIEAMAHGIPVISTNRGCIEEMLPASAGLVVAAGQDFVEAALGQLHRWRQFPGEFAQCSSASVEHYCQMRAQSEANLRMLIEEIALP